MTGKQRAVLWLGLILIILNLVSKWSEIKSVIFAGSGSSSSGGGFQLPPLPFPIPPTLAGTNHKTPSDTVV